MFKLAPPDQIYKRTVNIRQPQAKGTTRIVSFTAEYYLLTTEELNDILTPSTKDYDFISRVMAGWDGIQAHDGTPLGFTDANLKLLCSIGYWAKGVVEDYLAFHRGEPAKN